MADTQSEEKMVDKAKRRKRRITKFLRTQRSLRFSLHNFPVRGFLRFTRHGVDCARSALPPFGLNNPAQQLTKADAQLVLCGLEALQMRAASLGRYE